MPAVSVIVPVYNTPKAYLEYCIYSVLNQTFKDFELILVDDGSNDGCRLLCDEIGTADSRIVVIHQGNKGVSAARNQGILVAKGKYIVFLDSDDSLLFETLETLYKHAEINLSDIVLFEYSQNGIRYSLFEHDVDYIDDSLEQDIFLSTLLPLKRHGVLLCGVCCKFYRRSFLIDSKVKFPNGIASAEDQIFFLSCLNKNPRISYCARPFYEYRYVEKSASYSYTENFYQQVLDYFKLLDNIAGNSEIANLEVVLATRKCQCLLYALSKDFFHKGNLKPSKQKRDEFKSFTNGQECRSAVTLYDKKYFRLSERIGLWLLKNKCYSLIKIASLRW